MNKISEADFKALSSDALAKRIDAFIFSYVKATPMGASAPPMVLSGIIGVTASDILKTKMVSALDEAVKRTALTLFFRARMQEFIADAFIFSGAFTAPQALPLKLAYIAQGRQGQVIAARIAFECLMEFVTVVVTGEVMHAKRSKLGKFRKWLCVRGNIFGWLLFSLPYVIKFDRSHRTPEIHGTSFVTIDALRGEDMPTMDGEFNLINMQRNIWGAIRATLDGQDGRSFASYPEDIALIKANIDNWNKLDLDDFWQVHWSHLH